MNRRQLLATGALALTGPLAGCLGSSEPITPSGTVSAPSKDCGPASQPLSARLGDDPGDPSPCFEGATPSLVVENERDDEITVDIDVAGFTATESLDAGERVVASSAFEAAESLSGTVTVDGERFEVEWPERSCYRHGIAIDDSPEVGWVEPLRGPGDTQHDCYPATSVPLRVATNGESRTLNVTVTDDCADKRTERTLQLAAGTSERLDGLLESGGRYTITVDVEGGGTESYEFDDACWGVFAGVMADGTIRLGEIGID